MRLAGVVAAAAVLALPAAAAGERTAPASTSKTPRTVIALERSRASDSLVRVDADSLRPVSRRLRLDGHAYAWSFSPDGSRLAIGVDRALGIRVVDVGRLKRTRTIRTWNGNVFTLAWLAPRSIVGVEETGLFVVDLVARRRLRRPSVTGDILAVRRGPSVLLCIVAPAAEVGPARLVAVGPDGGVRSVTLDRIRAGIAVDEDAQRGERHSPGLAVDPAGRAFVVGGGAEPVAEVDLATLRVAYHDPAPRRSLLTRLHDWLQPVAEAKLPLEGSHRQALWLGDGRLAVWGIESTRAGDEVETTSVGLSIVDTSDWSLERIDPRATQVALAGETLLTVGDSSGLHGFSTSGAPRFELFADETLGIAATFGARAYVVPPNGPARVIDATNGRQIGIQPRIPQLLHPQFSWW